MSIFPTSPATGARHTKDGVTWEWTGRKWAAVGVTVTSDDLRVSPIPNWVPTPGNVQVALEALNELIPGGPPPPAQALTGISLSNTTFTVDGGEPGPGPGPGEWPEPVSGRMFYIAANGSDTNPGSRTQPWATVTRVNSEPKQPGDAYMFRSTDTFQGQGIRNIGNSGTASAPISYRSYGPNTSRATIRPGTSTITGSNMQGTLRDCGLYVRNASYNHISDLVIIGTGSRDTYNTGVLFEANSNDLTRYPGNQIRNLDISQCGRRAISVVSSLGGSYPTANSGFDDVVIDRCVARDNFDGIWAVGAKRVGDLRNVTITNCVAYNNHGGGAGNPNLGTTVFDGYTSGIGITIGCCEGALIENCVVYSNGAESTMGGPLGIMFYDSNAGICRYCEAYNNQAHDTDGGGFDIDGGCTNCLFEYCYSHDNRGPGFQYWIYVGSEYTGNNWYRFCVSQNDATDAAYNAPSIQAGTSDPGGVTHGKCTFHNCVVYQSRSRNIMEQQTAFGPRVPVDFFNCIFISAGAARFVNQGNSSHLRFFGNNWVGSPSTTQFNWNGANYSTLAAWRAAPGNPERLSGADTGGTWAHGLNNAGNGGTLVPAGQPATPAMFHAWQPYQLTSGSQNRGAGLNIQQHFSVNPGSQDMFGNPIQATSLSIGAHSPAGVTPAQALTAINLSSTTFTVDGAGPEPGDQWPEPVTGRMYYIASNGSNSNPGTKEQPWATIAQVNAHAKQPGDAYMFRSTDTFTGGALEISASGTAASPIFYRSYGPNTSRATIQPGNDNGIYLHDAAYNRVSDLVLVGNGSRGAGELLGIYLETNQRAQYAGNQFHNLDISAFSAQGIVAWTAVRGNYGYNDLIIDGCYVHDNNDGIAFAGYNDGDLYSYRNVTVRNCVSCRNHGGQRFNTGNGIVLGSVDGGLVENCVAYENGTEVGPSGPLGIWCYDSNAVVFRYCESYRNWSNWTDGGGFDIDGGSTNCVFEYCYSHDNRGPGLQHWVYSGAPHTANNIFRFCVSQNDGTQTDYQSINIGGSSGGGCTFHNCVIYQSLNRNIVYREGTVPSDFFNCIFIAAGAARFVLSGSTGSMRFNGNNYVGSAPFNWGGTNHTTLAAWRGATGSPETLAGADTSRTWAHGLNNAGNGGTLAPAGQPVTPAMFHAWQPYQLTSASQNRGAGLNIQQHFSLNPGPQDMFGNPIQATALSIGAYSRIA